MAPRFGAFDLDLDRGLLRHGAGDVPLRRKTFLVLAHLVRHHDRLVSREELRAAVWPDVRVSDTTLATTVHELREALLARDPSADVVRTAHGRGYRFVGLFEAAAVLPENAIAPLPAPSCCERFVGRGAVLADADQWIDEVAAGVGHAYVLSGPPGIGVSRTLREIGRRAAARGVAVHGTRCLEEAGAPAYWPWVELLRGLVGSWSGSGSLAREGQFAAVFALLGEPAGAGEGSDVERFALWDAVSGLLRAASRAQPRLLILDDLHRADEASARLFLHVLRTLGDSSVLVLGGLREWEVPAGHPLDRVLAELHGAGRMVPMRGLEPAETADLAACVTGSEPKIDVVAALQARTAGQPLFVLEIARALEAECALDDPGAVERILTPTLRRVVEGWLAPLDPVDRGVLAAAARLGPRFEVAALEQALEGVSPEAVRRALHAAVRRGLVAAQASEPWTFRFEAVLVRDVLLEEASRGTSLAVPGRPTSGGAAARAVRDGSPTVSPER